MLPTWVVSAGQDHFTETIRNDLQLRPAFASWQFYTSVFRDPRTPIVWPLIRGVERAGGHDSGVPTAPLGKGGRDLTSNVIQVMLLEPKRKSFEIGVLHTNFKGDATPGL